MPELAIHHLANRSVLLSCLAIDLLNGMIGGRTIWVVRSVGTIFNFDGEAIMLWWAFSLFFFWLSLREIYYGFVPRAGFDSPSATISTPYVLTTLAIAAAFAYTPVRYWAFERFLSEKAKILSETNTAEVHCNTVFDTLFDRQVFAAGHAQIETGRIVFQYPWCGRLMDHLDHPEIKTREAVFSLHIFAHEAMHIRGERDEAKTDCQAIQRYARAAKLLGVASETMAKENGMFYYQQGYQDRAAIGGMAGQYYSDQCAPGKALDEKLSDSTWN